MQTVPSAHKAFLVTSVLLTALVLPNSAMAATGGPQICAPSSSCSVGEFLYDDAYTPITTATCTLTSRNPDGTVFLSAVAMTPAAASDGWYSYNVTTPATTGLYRSQVCCTSGADYLCIDKTFEVKSSTSLSSSDVSSAVWNANRSSYTSSGSFGETLQSLVPSSSDISAAVWGYSGRTLTGFGSLVTDIWGSATRTLTGAGLSSGSLATQSDVTSVATSVASVQTDVDSLQSDVSTVKSDVSTVKSDVSTVKSDVSTAKTDISSVKTTVSSISSPNLDAITNNINQVKKITTENQNLLEQVVNKPIIQNFIDEEKDVNLQSKIDQTKNSSKQLSSNTQNIKSKLDLMKSKWSSFDDGEVIAAVAEISDIVGKEGSTSDNSIFSGVNWLKDNWNMPVALDLYNQTLAARQTAYMLQDEVNSFGKSKTSYNEIKTLSATINKMVSGIGDISNTKTQKTLYGKIKEVQTLADALDAKTATIDSLLASWNTYQYSDAQKKINAISKEVATINKLPRLTTILVANKFDESPDKLLKNRALTLRGVVNTNRLLLARKPEKAFGNTWLEEGSVVFKSLVTNPSLKITQKFPLKYYLPPEIKKEHILNVDEGLAVSYDAEKNQYFVEGEFTLAPGESKTLSVHTVDIWVYSDEQIATLRKQAEELSKPLNNTSYFAQGVTLKSDIDVSLDKVVSLQKAASTPEAKIRAYRESEIEMNAVTTKMDKLKELVASAGSVGSLTGFVGGAQTLAVWGLIIIFVAGFVFLALYMRVLRPHSAPELTGEQANSLEIAAPVGKKGKKKQVEEEVVTKETIKKSPFFHTKIGIASIVIVFGVIASGTTGLVMAKVTSPKPVDQAKVDAPQVIEQPSTVLGINNINNEEASPSSTLVENVVEKTTPEVKEEVAKIVVIKDTPTGFLRVRSAPGGLEVTQVDPGSSFPLVEENTSWYQIKLEDGTEGWVSKQYARVDSVM